MAEEKPYELTDVSIELVEGAELGVILALDLSVKEVRTGSPAHGRILPGDRIVTINGELLSGKLDDFVQRHRPHLRMRIFKQRAGYEYHLANIALVHQGHFGLTMKDASGRTPTPK